MPSTNSRNLFPICLSLFAFALILGCSKDDDSGGPGSTPPMEEEDTCEGINPSFADNIKPIIDASCAIENCHVAGGAGDGNFTTYAGIKAKADNGNLLLRAVQQANMPPGNSTGPDPTDAQRNMIKCWIEDGAPDN